MRVSSEQVAGVGVQGLGGLPKGSEAGLFVELPNDRASLSVWCAHFTCLHAQQAESGHPPALEMLWCELWLVQC